MVPFGFSAGDFIAAIIHDLGLIAKVSKAVKDKTGASSEHQQALLELQSLDRTLRRLQSLQPTESNANHVNAIRGMALTCRFPLQHFLEKMQKYEYSLGPFATQSRFRMDPTRRKLQWAVFMTDEVGRLRTAIGGKVLSINLLLAVHTSESLSSMEAEAHKSHATLLASILEHRLHLEKIQNEVVNVEKSINNHAKIRMENSKELGRENHERGKHKYDKLSVPIYTASTYCRFHSLPSQVREALKQVIRSNVQMYTMLRAIHSRVVSSPTYQPADTIRFEDVLGRTKSLPYEYFRHVEWRPDQRRQMNDYGVSGAHLVMSVFMRPLSVGSLLNRCPRYECAGVGVARDVTSFWVYDQCSLEFCTMAESDKSDEKDDSRKPDTKSLSTRSETAAVEKSPDQVQDPMRVFRRVHLQIPSFTKNLVEEVADVEGLDTFFARQTRVERWLEEPSSEAPLTGAPEEMCTWSGEWDGDWVMARTWHPMARSSPSYLP
ncbi:hypothetical protein K458DRAFT_485063 [Lentithecium fluviatile CBS 122367]|uniref:Fungal N-terminal domain-containing protein n=1 Tax=Lentithecium fluviatile CBS 122367 TaxID=1168545 RepID=A0A6G1JCJ7_9PLEO|nr:hypothetical protein K458DRAFT_485063 [Lentithecium fluviatile CBS 122367]